MLVNLFSRAFPMWRKDWVNERYDPGIPSSKGRESTTITENRFPSSCARSRIFSTTDDLRNVTRAVYTTGRVNEPSISKNDISVLDFLACKFLNNFICNDNPIPDIVINLLAQDILGLDSSIRESKDDWNRSLAYILFNHIDV